MSRQNSRRGAVSLPKGVHHCVSRWREYFYYQTNRGTPRQGPRIALAERPAFAGILERAAAGTRAEQGLAPRSTLSARRADAFIAHCAKRVAAGDLSDGTLLYISARHGSWRARRGVTYRRRDCAPCMSKPRWTSSPSNRARQTISSRSGTDAPFRRGRGLRDHIEGKP